MQGTKYAKLKSFLFLMGSRWYWGPAGTLILSLVSIGMLFWSYSISEKQRMDFHICDALMDIQNLIASSHLWIHEAAGGDEAVDVNKIKDDVDLVFSLSEAILRGGKSEHGELFDPVRDPEPRKRAEEIRTLVTEYRGIALQGLEDPATIRIGSSLDRDFNTVFKEFQGKAHALEFMIEKDQIRAHAHLKRLFLGVLVTWISIVFLATIAIWNQEARRKAAEEALQKANEQLRLQAKELKKHEGQLMELVEERTAGLTASNRSLQQEIKERKEAEKSSQASAKRFRTLMEHLPLRIFLTVC